MSQAYITNGNLKKIISPFNLKGRSYGNKEFFIDIKNFDVNLLKKILSIPELALLEAYKEVLVDLEEGIAMYVRIEKRDTHTYVYEGISPAYHMDYKCERLKSDFINYEIPEIIKDDFDEIEKFRKIFKDNFNTIKDGRPDVARLRINIAMGWDIDYQSISDVDYKNSKSAIFENDDLETIERKISEIMFNADAFRNSSPEATKVIDQLGYGTHKRKEKNEPNHPLSIWHSYKTELKHVIQTYFRIKFNPNLKFEGKILEELGFRPCSLCSVIR